MGLRPTLPMQTPTSRSPNRPRGSTEASVRRQMPPRSLRSWSRRSPLRSRWRHSASPDRARSWSWRTSAFAEIQQAAGTEPLQLGDDRFLESDRPDEPSWRWPWRRSGRHDPAGRWRRLTNRIRHEHPVAAGESARMRYTPRNHVAYLVNLRLQQLRDWRDAAFAEGRGGSTIRRRALAAIAVPAQREEARRQLGRSVARLGSRLAMGSTARQTWVASPGFASTSTFTTLRSPA